MAAHRDFIGWANEGPWPTSTRTGLPDLLAEGALVQIYGGSYDPPCHAALVDGRVAAAI
jgi:hypothetical protein